MAKIEIWPGSTTWTAGKTAFGFYDDDSDFQTEAPQFATWCARRLGYPLMSVELQDVQFYACLEESISEYSAQVNQFNIVDNLLTLRGQPTGSNFTHKRVTNTFANTIKLSQAKLLNGFQLYVDGGGKNFPFDLTSPDAITYDMILQYALFGEVIYG